MFRARVKVKKMYEQWGGAKCISSSDGRRGQTKVGENLKQKLDQHIFQTRLTTSILLAYQLACLRKTNWWGLLALNKFQIKQARKPRSYASLKLCSVECM